MPIQRFKTKPVEIDAIRWTGDNIDELHEWTQALFVKLDEDDDWHIDDPEFTGSVFDVLHSTWIGVKTGQWIVCGAKGEFYPCDDETFHWKYEEVDSPLVFPKPDYGVGNND